MTETKTPWQRLEAVIAWSGLTINSFAMRIGLSRGENLYQIKRGNHGISLALADRIIRHFPEIDKLWLLTGDGEMLSLGGRLGGVIPYYNCDLEGAIRAIGQLTTHQSMCVPQLPDCEFAINYMGAEMGERTPTGTVVLLKKIDTTAIIPGREYVIITKKIVTLRIVRAGADAESLRLVAADRTNFDDVEVPMNEVEAVYAVQGKLVVTK